MSLDLHRARLQSHTKSKMYAETKPKIVLETTSATGAKLALFLTYAAFIAAVVVDVNSTLSGANPVVLASSICSKDIPLNSSVTKSCTTPLQNQTGVWEAYITDLTNLVGTIKLLVKFPNGTSCPICTSTLATVTYDISVYGCYEASGCSDNFEKVLRTNTSATLSSSILDTIPYFQLMSIFQNQESLPGLGRVRSYHIQVSYSDNAGLLDGHWSSKYEFQYHSASSNTAEASFRIILLFAILTSGYFWFYYLLANNSVPWKWLRERKWLTFFLIGVFIYVNPLYCAAIFLSSPSRRVIFASELLGGIGISILLGVWLMFADGYNRAQLSRLRFYGPKVLFAVLILFTSIALTTLNYPSFYSGRSPLLAVQNWPRSLQIGYLSGCAIFITLFCLWTVWYTFSLGFTFNSLRKEPYMKTRYKQLSFRFFVLQASLVGVAYVSQYVAIAAQIAGNSSHFTASIEASVDNFNQLLRTSTQAFGQSLFITVYLCIILYLHLPPSVVASSSFNTTYVIAEKERNSTIKRRRRDKRNLKGLGRIIEAKNEVFCVEMAQWLLEIADQAYCDVEDAPLLGSSSTGHIDLAKIHYTLLTRLYDEVTETYCIICRHNTLPRLVVAFRGTCTNAHWNTNLQFQQVEIDLEKKLLENVDISDGLEEGQADVAYESDDDFADVDDSNAFEDDAPSSPTPLSPSLGSRNLIQKGAERLGERMNRGVDMIEDGVGFIGRTVATAVSVTRVNRIPVLKQALKIFLHKGFWSSYETIRENLHELIRRELKQNPAHLYVTGHSLGGALATLAAADLAIHTLPRLNAYLYHLNTANNDSSTVRQPRKIGLTMYNFGSPRVGNHQFSSHFNKLVPDAFRVVVDGDIVTGVPSTWYKHVGTEIILDGLHRCGTIIVDPSFVEKRLNTTSKTKVQVHSTKFYRQGLEDVVTAAKHVMEQGTVLLRDPSVGMSEFLAESDLESATSNSKIPEDLKNVHSQGWEALGSEVAHVPQILTPDPLLIEQTRTTANDEDAIESKDEDLATLAAEQLGGRDSVLKRSWQSVKQLSYAFRGNQYFEDPDANTDNPSVAGGRPFTLRRHVSLGSALILEGNESQEL